MCGRFTLVRLSDFLDQFPWILPPIGVPDGGGDGRYNIAPTQPVAAVLAGAQPHVQFVQWGLVPSWADEASVGSKMINARAETLAERPAFRKLVAAKRCLIPADGFYEWQAVNAKHGGKGPKVPHYVRLRSGQPFALAGLWDQWRDPSTGRPLTTCTIITTEPNAIIRPLHSRMAVLVRPDDYRAWLSARPLPAEQLAAVLSPYPAEQMEAYPVSTAVNRPAADGPELTAPVDPATPTAELQPSLFG